MSRFNSILGHRDKARIMQSIAILIVHPREGIQNLLQYWLTQSGHEVTCVTRSSVVVPTLRWQSYDLLIADLEMIKGNLDVVGTSRQALPAIGIIALAPGCDWWPGGLFINSIDQRFGAHATLGLPFNRLQLLEAIAEVMKPFEARTFNSVRAR